MTTDAALTVPMQCVEANSEWFELEPLLSISSKRTGIAAAETVGVESRAAF